MGIEIKNLTKHFGGVCALDNVSTKFESNRIYGLLGRNGAGKSTLLNIISNRIMPDSGSVIIDGEPAWENDRMLKRLYIMSENNFYPEKMKIRSVFKWTKEFYPDFDMDYAVNLAEQFELDVNKNPKSLSTGFSSIFKLIIALSVNVPYVFFDEPVLGLDANNRDLFYRLLIEKYSSTPFTAVISTHLIDEVSGVIDGIVIIKNGKVIKDETRDTLLSQGYTVSGNANAVDAYIAGRNVMGVNTLGGLKTAYILGDQDATAQDGLEFSTLDLEKLFIQLTNS